MASCHDKCSSFAATDGEWFKIDQAGYINSQWASDKLIAGTSALSETAHVVATRFLIF